MLKNPAEYERYMSPKFTTISRQVSPHSLLGFSAGLAIKLWQMNEE
jgi:hypothetical protein